MTLMALMRILARSRHRIVIHPADMAILVDDSRIDSPIGGVGSFTAGEGGVVYHAIIENMQVWTSPGIVAGWAVVHDIEIEMVRLRCLDHKDCRDHPRLGISCLMASGRSTTDG